MAELNRSKFALLAECSRQNIKKKVDDGTLVLNENGKLDTENPENKFWLEQRKSKTKLKMNNPGKRIYEEPVKKIKSNSIEKESVLKIKKNIVPIQEEQEETLSAKKLRIEVQKLEEQRDKLIRENKVGRAELIDREEFSDRVFTLIAALFKNIMEMPAGYIDEIEAGIKSGSTRSELINIATGPICEAISETKKEIQKDIKKIIRSSKKQ